MTNKLPPEVRVKVAGECGIELGNMPVKNINDWFNPIAWDRHYRALVSTVARLIEEYSGVNDHETIIKRVEYSAGLRHALSTNSTDDLERLCAELRGFV